MKTKLWLLGIAALVLPGFAAEQATPPAPETTRLDGSKIVPADIDGTVAQLIKAAEVPGLRLALFNGGKRAYLKSYGVRDKEKNLTLDVNSVMSGASFTKVAFGYLVLRLADEKKPTSTSPPTNTGRSRCPNTRLTRIWPATRDTRKSPRECC